MLPDRRGLSSACYLCSIVPAVNITHMSTMPALRVGGAAAPTPHLQNVVVTFRIGLAKVDLRRLACLVPWVEYDPRKFAAATMRLACPRSTCLLFGSGRGVCTGAKTECEARHAAYSYVCLLRRLGTPCAFESFKVQNIVCAVHCNFRLDLCSLARAHTDACGYEPDLFPGLPGVRFLRRGLRRLRR